MKSKKVWLLLAVIGLSLIVRSIRRAEISETNFGSYENKQEQEVSRTQASQPKQSEEPKGSPPKSDGTNGRNLEPSENETVESLSRRLNTKLRLNTRDCDDPAKICRRFRLSGEVALKELKSEGEPDSTAIRRYIELAKSKNILEVDRPEQLQEKETKNGVLGKITVFQQYYDLNGTLVPVQGGMVRVHQNSRGDIFTLNNSFIPNVSGISASINVDEDEAKRLAAENSRSLDPDRQDPEVGNAQSVIFRFSNKTVDLSWKIVVTQPGLGADSVGTYFISVHDPSLIERRQTSRE